MSQPVLKVDLPLNGDKPEYETDKTKADHLKTNAPQEERRRGFQMTNICLDKQLLNVTGLLRSVYMTDLKQKRMKAEIQSMMPMVILFLNHM